MITEQQRELRKQYICSSDSAAILGVDPYRSAAEVWADKTGKADDFEGNANTARGNFLEPAILDWATVQIGRTFNRDQMLVHPQRVLAANFDGLCDDDAPDPFMVEAKSSVVSDEWGTPGTDEVPERVLVQTHHAMYVAGCSVRTAFVPVLLPGGFRSFDFRLYRIERDDELADAIAAKAVDFMERFIRTGTRPDDFRPGIEILKRWRRQPNKTVHVPDELVDAVIVARAARKQAEVDCENAEKALLTAMDDAEGGSYSRGTCSYLESKRAGYTVEPTAFRSLRFKTNKPTKKEKDNVAAVA